MTQAGVSIVTGGAGGIGSAVVARFASLGDTVYLVDFDSAAVGAVTAELNAAPGTGAVIGVSGDIASDESNRALISRVRDEAGRLDRLVNAAGVQQRAPFGEITHAEFSRVLDVNLWGMMSMCQAAAELWREHPGGAIVNIGSRAWLSGGKIAYAASKAGVVGLTRALAGELGQYSVTVNAVAPSTVVTPIVAQGRSSEEYEAHLAHVRELPLLPRIAEVDDVVNAVVFLATPGSGFITGEIINVAGGSQLAPLGG